MSIHDKEEVSNAVTTDAMRQAMRRFASGVTIVTSMDKHGPTGITVSAFYSVSLSPPVVMISINTESSLVDAIRTSGRFSVHILADEHSKLSEQFAESTEWDRKVGNYDWHVSDDGSPIIDAIPTVLEAAVDRTVRVGTHDVVFGNVTGIEASSDTPRTPLLYYDRNYRTLDPRTDTDG